MTKKQEHIRRDFVVVHGEDWTGLYLNGQLIDENHSFSLREVAERFNLPITFITAEPDDRGYPALEKDLKRSKKRA
jgi:hypothetical protein